MKTVKLNSWTGTRKRALIACLIAVVLAGVACTFPGCGEKPPEPTIPVVPTVDVSTLPPTAPKIVYQRPLPGEELPLDGAIDIYFDQPMDRASVESALSVEPSIAYSVEWVDDSTLRVKPEPGALQRASTYTLTVAAGVKSQAGTTSEDFTKLEVVTVGNLSVGEVVPGPDSIEIDPTSVITVFFNRPVVPLTIGEAASGPDPLTFQPAVRGEGEWINTSIYQFTPADPLLGGQTYSVSIDPGLSDQTGGSLEGGYAWQFTTAVPQVTNITPERDGIYLVDQTITVEFNQPMDRRSVERAFSLTTPTQRVNARFEWSEGDRLLTVTPAPRLPFGETVTVTIAASAQGVGGMSLPEPVSWAINTYPLPAVSGTVPFNGQRDVPVWQGITINFTAPVDGDTIADRVTVDPPLQGETYGYFSTWDNSYVISAYFEPQTQYTVTVQPGISDSFGNVISTPYSFSFTTGDLDPGVTLNTPGFYGIYNANVPTELFVTYRNVSTIDFTLASLTPPQFASLLNPDSGGYIGDYLPNENDVIRRWSIEADAPRNEQAFARVALAEDGGALPPGIYALVVDAPEIEGWIRHFLVVSSASMAYKTTFDESLVWLTTFDGADPVAGATVEFYDDEFNRVGSGRTGADGVLIAPVGSRSSLWDVQYALWQEQGSFALALSTWSDDLDPWVLGYNGRFETQHYTTYIYTDRPIYRPGQEVHFKGILRARNDMTYSIAPDASVPISIYNERGDIIYEEDLPVNEMGTFEGTLTLGSEAGLGYYGIQTLLGDQYYSIGFQVAEYRPPDFQVQVTAASDQVVAGDVLDMTVDASFFFGGPVSEAEVSWNLLAEDYYFDYQGPGRYSFFDYTYDQYLYSAQFVPGFGALVDSGSGVTDQDGQFSIRPPARLGDTGAPRRMTFEATVTDLEGRPVSGRTSVIVHPAQFYVGVQPREYVSMAGQQTFADLIVVDWDSQPVVNHEVSVELVRRVWNSVLEEDEFGRTAYTWVAQDTPVSDRIVVTTDSQGHAEVSFTPPDGGVYVIKATVEDDAGRRQRSAGYLWVSSGNYIAWRQTNTYITDVIADATSYSPGDTAEVLITSPWAGEDVQALITIERGSILSSVVVPMPTNSYVYRVPITGELAPTVYVTALIVRGGGAEGVADFRIGTTRLAVEPVEQTLDLTVTPDREQVGPGEQVTYTVETRDFAGTPVDAEVSLALVDLAVLQLAPPNVGPIVDAFYGEQGLGVRTAMPLALLVDRLTQSLLDQGKGGGGGGGDGFFELRENFQDTAAWVARLRTGETGSTQVTFTLPDNLTTWRLDARGVTADTLVGQVERDIIATRPLIVRPITPRFFVAGDQVTLLAAVNNTTDTNVNVTVTLEGTGISIVNDESQIIGLPAGGRGQVAWSVVVDENTDWVDLTFKAVSDNNLSDSSKPPLGDPDHGRMLPVYRYEVPETVGTAGRLDGPGERLEGVVRPPTYDIKAGDLTVRIDPSLAAATLDALEFLEHYPYECTEQTVSRFLPNVLTLRAFRTFGLQDAELEAGLQQQVSNGLQRLYSQQHEDGGWGWFVESNSDPLVTAYVVQGLVGVRDAGLTVDPNVLERGLGFLQNSLFELDTLSEQTALHRQAYILYVLAQAGQPDASRNSNLYEARGGMQHFAWALLAQAMAAVDPADPRLATLEAGLINNAILSATGAHWEEDYGDSWNWNTDTRSTAIIVDTMAKLWPQSDLLPMAVRWLMIARRGSHWETTQETAWALIGLTDYMVATSELDASYDWTFAFNGIQQGTGQVSRDNLTEAQVFVIDIAQVVTNGVNRLSFQRGEGAGRMYYTAHLTAFLPVEEVPALARGIIVSRRYLDADGRVIDQARVGDVITVEVTLVAPNDLYYVVLEDPYPAGAEAIDTSLLTESVVSEGPVLRPDDPLARGWGWWWFSRTEFRDEKAVLYADFLPGGTYQYTYQIRAGLVGTYRVIPTHAQEFYLPEVNGRGSGSLFTILPPR